MNFSLYTAHQLALPSVSPTVGVTLTEDYAVAQGICAETGLAIFPTSSDNRYLVPGGVAGLPYLSRLGAEGAPVVNFTFPKPVTSVVVVTHSSQAPTVRLFTGRVVVGFHLSEHRYINGDSAQLVGNSWNFTYTFSDGSNVVYYWDDNNGHGNGLSPEVVGMGKTADELTALGMVVDNG